MSLRRSTFKLNDGKFPGPGGRRDSRAQPPTNHEQIVIEVKSEKSDRSAGQHLEYQVEVKKQQGKSPGISPAHGSAHGQAPSKFSANTEPLYKVWTGEQLFLFNGKIQLGINVWQPLITFTLINVLQLCLLGNTIADLLKKKEGYEAVFVIGLVLELVASIFLWVTAAKDPATVPSRVSRLNFKLHVYRLLIPINYLGVPVQGVSQEDRLDVRRFEVQVPRRCQWPTHEDEVLLCLRYLQAAAYDSLRYLRLLH